MTKNLKLSFLFFPILSFAEEICKRNFQNTALVVIDMQQPFIDRGGDADDPENIIAVKNVFSEILNAIELAIENQMPIAFLEYEGYGDTNARLLKAVRGYSKFKVIQKDEDGMFNRSNGYRDDLIQFVNQYQIGTFLITGANGGACVFQSIDTSLDVNCSVIAFSKGIADFNFDPFIHPYRGRYSSIRANCPSCYFKEIFDLSEFETAVEVF